MKYKCLFFLFSTFPLLVQGQFAFKQKTDVPVTVNGPTLANPWAGGLNSGQYNTIDLNLDGFEDLVVFDRTSNKLNTFLSIDQAYQYAPEYEALFPAGLNSWLLLVDYNCDGKKDIFSNSTFGIKAYRNQSNEQLSFEFIVDPIQTEGINSEINLQVSNADIPAITDVDGDGDVDVLVFNFLVGGIMEFHQNLSMETDGTCNNLIFKRLNQAWGDFTECDCGVVSFGGNCNDIGGRTASPTHSGGKSVLAFDTDGDNDVELIFGDELCREITYMENLGTPETPQFSSLSTQYPDQLEPADFINFPSAFYEDVDFDGKKDLLIAPNLITNTIDKRVNFQQSSWLYRNVGATDKEQRFEFVKKSFLQDQMIELGENAAPALVDYDGDGDLDIIVGNSGTQLNGEFIASLSLLENKGTATLPSFELINDDYLNLSQSKFRDAKPYFVDLNNDGKKDLLLAATAIDLTHHLYFLPNQASGSGQQFDVSSPREVALAIAENDNPYFYDVDNDGFVDLLLGKVTGGLEYRRNTGNTTDPTFILETDAFAGISNNTGRRNLVPLMDDINNDGVADLLVIDDSGILRVYTDFLNQTEPQITSELIDNSLTNQPTTSRLGRRNWMATGKLFGNNLPALLIGSIQGGLFFFENLSEDGNFNGGNQETFVVEIFPNPGPPFKIRSNQPYSYFLYSTLGQLISAEGPIAANQTRMIDSGNLRGGMYILKAVSASGSSSSQKIIVAPK